MQAHVQVNHLEQFIIIKQLTMCIPNALLSIPLDPHA